MTLGHYSQLAAKVKTAATTSYVVILDPEPYSGTKNDPNKYAEKVKWINDCFQDNSITINQWYLGKCEPNNHNHYVFYAISHLSIYPYNHLYIHPSIYVSDIYSYICPSIHPYIYLSIDISIVGGHSASGASALKAINSITLPFTPNGE